MNSIYDIHDNYGDKLIMKIFIPVPDDPSNEDIDAVKNVVSSHIGDVFDTKKEFHYDCLSTTPLNTITYDGKGVSIFIEDNESFESGYISLEKSIKGSSVLPV